MLIFRLRKGNELIGRQMAWYFSVDHPDPNKELNLISQSKMTLCHGYLVNIHEFLWISCPRLAITIFTNFL